MTETKSALILRCVTNEIMFEVSEGIGILTVNRPEARNALNWAAQEKFANLITQCSEDPSLRALILTGTGEKAFVAGADIAELKDRGAREARQGINITLFDRLAAIAAGRGRQYGGLDMHNGGRDQTHYVLQ